MAPKRRAAGKRGRDLLRQTVHNNTSEDNDQLPEAYQDMLAEAARRPPLQAASEAKTTKRRKLDETSSQVMAQEIDSTNTPLNDAEFDSQGEAEPVASREQRGFDDFTASDDDEEEEEFEDVDLDAVSGAVERQEAAEESLHLDLSIKPTDYTGSIAGRRKPPTAVERKLRLDVHKWHILCLLAHVRQRNYWCEDNRVQATLKALVPRKLIKLLHMDTNQPQHQRNHSFNSALDEISKIWRSEWKITEQGMRRSYWKEEPANDLQNVEDLPDPVDLEDFRSAANNRSGSRDLGAQLFCSLLRAAAVDTRLVCSLQPLPFSGVAKGSPVKKAKAQYITATSLGQQPEWNHLNISSDPTSSIRHTQISELDKDTSTHPASKIYRTIRDSPYPIFWVEVFSDAMQKWIPIDPLVRNTINKPKTGFEPPASDALNSLVYIIAFEEEGSARDVTRRYTQFYNGKTRRSRVESRKGGQRWWERTMLCLEKVFPEDRDDIENSELLAREISEQMPKNVQDFKNHPQYVLERHLKRVEVIHPKREVGKVRAGPSRGSKLEPVFRRKDVLVVKTTDQWYRLGRDVKVGERPLKELMPRKINGIIRTEDEDEEAIEKKATLYAEFQTEIYLPPPIMNGKVPRNAYGNLDVYVRSMIPAGGIHVAHPEAARAAKVLGVDYVNAVTGFEFKGRQGTAVLSGIVAPAEYREAFMEVLEGIRYERACEIYDKRSAIALKMWKRFLTALRIRDKIREKYVEGEDQSEGESEEDPIDRSYQDDGFESDEAGGGFFPEPTSRVEAFPQPAETQSLDFQGVFDLQLAIDDEAPILVYESTHRLPRQALTSDEEEVYAQDSMPSIALHSQQNIFTKAGSLIGTGSGRIHPEFEVGDGGFLPEPTPINTSTRTQTKEMKSSTDCSVDVGLIKPSDDKSVPQRSADDDFVTTFGQQTRLNDQSLHKNRLPSRSFSIFEPTASNTSNPPISFETLSETAEKTQDVDGKNATTTPDSETNESIFESSSVRPEEQTERGIEKGKAKEESDEDGESDDTSLEQGSLLSHDPEDDNAEPEWLAEVLDSD